MKLILLAATALVAAPLAAQTTPAMPDQSTMPAEQTTTDPTPASPAPMPMQSQPMQQGQPMQNQSMSPTTMPQGNMPSEPTSGPMQGSTMTPGGYQPSAPPMSGTMTPGVAPIYRAAPTPDQAYPAPAALDHYPICKKGQYDKCMQPGGR